MTEKKKWIKGATEGSHGQFRKKAEKAGKSTAAYAREHEGDSGKLGKQARLAETLMRMQHAHQNRLTPEKTIRISLYE